jgi:hypothetical protein
LITGSEFVTFCDEDSKGVEKPSVKVRRTLFISEQNIINLLTLALTVHRIAHLHTATVQYFTPKRYLVKGFTMTISLIGSDG